MLARVAALLSLIVLLAGCRRQTVVAVGGNELFALDYGSFEDELDLFALSASGTIRTSLTMRDGFFYIANGEAQKIMELNSYGDLLGLYYNDERMKTPPLSGQEGGAARKAFVYPFYTLGPLAVDSRKNLYVVDTLPTERQETDGARRLLLHQVVLRFASDGTFIDYLGQQGPGGTPFPFVRGIYTVHGDELVVICVINDGLVAYWFGANGFLLYEVPITTVTVPPLEHEDDEGDFFVSIESVIPDTQLRRLFVKLDYFQTTLDQAVKVASGVEYSVTLVFPLDIATGRYEKPLEIPPYEEVASMRTSGVPYDFLGVTDSGWLFFSVPTERGYQIQMVQASGSHILKRQLSVDHGEVLYSSLSLNESGIISALFAKRDRAEVVWWRTDLLVAPAISK